MVLCLIFVLVLFGVYCYCLINSVVMQFVVLCLIYLVWKFVFSCVCVGNVCVDFSVFLCFACVTLWMFWFIWCF